MNGNVALVLYAAMRMAFEMAGNARDLEDCAKENKAATDLLPPSLKEKLRAFYVERRDYLREKVS